MNTGGFENAHVLAFVQQIPNLAAIYFKTLKSLVTGPDRPTDRNAPRHATVGTPPAGGQGGREGCFWGFLNTLNSFLMLVFDEGIRV